MTDRPDPMKTAIVTALTGEIITDEGTSLIYPAYLTEVENPTYPCITITRVGAHKMPTLIAYEGFAKLDFWSKYGDDQLSSMQRQVEAIISNQYFTGIGAPFWFRLADMSDPMYEARTFTYHLSAKYQIFQMTL